ncbi:helix-turn-helix domain-containing protein [Entomomonas sp. E2T0]|uniref:helix-turn-helix domain-containing protein n=1 Tax=Entomomonas sp. E2T0 TaxID=2930213 RepID=UPI0022284841|nr:helix-turn-helix domain-containing protein [Entomomonas sp. E2T0]UYZ84346.1 helix-turn-helix domain-containing protein [Entomomonas sp. E2T0]
MLEEDWTPNEIIQALNKRGIKLYELLRTHKLNQGLQFKYSQLERVIADALNISVTELWPSRYLYK